MNSIKTHAKTKITGLGGDHNSFNLCFDEVVTDIIVCDSLKRGFVRDSLKQSATRAAYLTFSARSFVLHP